MTPREQEILRRTELSETRVTKAVFPPTTNHHNTLFGGTALAWMDEVSFITATRFCRLPLVTVSTDRIDFNHPIRRARSSNWSDGWSRSATPASRWRSRCTWKACTPTVARRPYTACSASLPSTTKSGRFRSCRGSRPARRLETGRKKAPTGAFSISPDDPALGWDQGRRLIFREAWDRSICCRLTLPNVCSRGAPAMRILSKRTSPILLGRRRLTEPSGLSVLCVLPVS